MLYNSNEVLTDHLQTNWCSWQRGLQLRLAHGRHHLLQLDSQRHVAIDTQLPGHEGHGGLQLP